MKSRSPNLGTELELSESESSSKMDGRLTERKYLNTMCFCTSLVKVSRKLFKSTRILVLWIALQRLDFSLLLYWRGISKDTDNISRRKISQKSGIVRALPPRKI